MCCNRIVQSRIFFLQSSSYAIKITMYLCDVGQIIWEFAPEYQFMALSAIPKVIIVHK